MGPGSFDPGSARTPKRRRQACQASMGPGSFDPGSGLILVDRRRVRAASMGPGSFDPGSRNGRPFFGIEVEGFNGAGVFRPRKSPLPRLSLPVAEPASMGPGSFDPGSGGKVTIARPGLRASMGPGSFDPGSWWWDRLVEPRAPASMGPGSFDPGSVSDLVGVNRHHGLQWGRGLSTPEVEVENEAPPEVFGLQWGRGLSTPEVHISSRVGCWRQRASMGPGSFDPGSQS